MIIFKQGNLLEDEAEAFERLEEVRDIIQGFETPYDLELLSTFHWVINEKPEATEDVKNVIEEVHNWNERKKNIFKEKHIQKAWDHLQRAVT